MNEMDAQLLAANQAMQPTLPAQLLAPLTAEPNTVLLASMVENLGKVMSQAMVEPERIKAQEETKRAEIYARSERTRLFVALGIVGMVLALALYAFTVGERAYLGQAMTLVFGFLGGMGLMKFSSDARK